VLSPSDEHTADAGVAGTRIANAAHGGIGQPTYPADEFAERATVGREAPQA
jgi:hypothetical protein